MLESLFHITSWYGWEDKIQPSGVLLPQCRTGERGITNADDHLWVSGVPYARSRYVFLAPEHRVDRLSRNYTGRSLAVLEFPVHVLAGARWVAVEIGRRKARWSNIQDVALNLHEIEMILTPDPIPLSALRSLIRTNGGPDVESEVMSDDPHDDLAGWLDGYWDYSHSMD